MCRICISQHDAIERKPFNYETANPKIKNFVTVSLGEQLFFWHNEMSANFLTIVIVTKGIFHIIRIVEKKKTCFAHLRMTNVYFGCVISESSCYDRTRHIPDNRARCDDENFMTYHTKVNTTDEPFKNTD